MREIGQAVGLTSTSTVHAHLAPRGARRPEARPVQAACDGPTGAASTAVSERADVRGLPLLGSVAAGTPILAEENIEE